MRHLLTATLLGLTLLVAACSGEDEEATSTSATATPKVTAAAKTTAAPAMTMPAGAGASGAAGISAACAEWSRATARIMPGGGVASPAMTPGAMGAMGAMPTFDKATLDQSKLAFDAAVAAAPAAIKADMQVMQVWFVDFTKAIESVNYDMMRLFSSPEGAKLLQAQSDPKLMQSMQNIATWTAANCGGTAVTPTPAR